MSVGVAAVVATAVVVLLACGDSSTTRVAGPSTLQGSWALAKLAAGDDLTTDTVLAKHAPLRVVVRFNGAAMSGAAVTWTVGGAIAASASTTTDADGVASLDFAFGSKAGPYVVQATLPQRPEVAPVLFSGTALPGRATALRVVAGNGQIDTATAQLRDSLVVRAVDSYENGTPGVAVDWVVTAGGGSVSLAQTTTLSPDGSSAVRYALGRAVGTNAVTASLHDADAKVTFQTGASAANPAKLTMVSGNNQTAVVNHALGADYVVKVTDNYDNVAAGAVIGWKITGGGGSLSASSVTSGPDGIGSTRSTLGPVNVAQSVNASLTAWPKVPAVTFSSIGTAPLPQPFPQPPPQPPPGSTLVLVSGDAQLGAAGSPLPAPIVVAALDASGNALPSQSINFSVTSGGGSVAPTFSQTNAQGQARTTWTLGPTDAHQTMTVSATFTSTVLTVNGLTGLPLWIGGDPSYYFYGLAQTIGIGQFTNAWTGPASFSPVSAPLTVNLSHAGASHTAVPSSATVQTGATVSQFQIVGTSVGTDAIVASAPGYAPMTLQITVDSGDVNFGVTGNTPGSIAVGELNEALVCVGPSTPAAATTFSLAANANIKFLSEGPPVAPITSITVPAGFYCAYFLVQGVSPGLGTVTIKSPNYRTGVGAINVTP